MLAHDELGGSGHDVHGAERIVGYLFRMPQTEVQIASGMAGIMAGGGITFVQGFRHVRVAERARIAAVAGTEEFAIPGSLGGHPDFEMDFGIGSGAGDGLNSAELRQIEIGATEQNSSG